MFFIIKQGNLSVNRKDLQALTLMGPTRENLVLDSLAVQHLHNQLYIYLQFSIFSRCSIGSTRQADKCLEIIILKKNTSSYCHFVETIGLSLCSENLASQEILTKSVPRFIKLCYNKCLLWQLKYQKCKGPYKNAVAQIWIIFEPSPPLSRTYDLDLMVRGQSYNFFSTFRANLKMHPKAWKQWINKKYLWS